jgi:hypothetical protein
VSTSVYRVEKGHHAEHLDGWALPQVHWLYSNNRGFSARTYVYTIIVDHVGASYRDHDPVRVDLALDYGYKGVVLTWFDGRDSRSAADVHAEMSKGIVPDLLTAPRSRSPRRGHLILLTDEEFTTGPMALGTPAGVPNRLLQIFFVDGEVRETVDRVHAYTDAVEEAGLTDSQLVARFLRTTPAKDTYLDQLGPTGSVSATSRSSISFTCIWSPEMVSTAICR